MNTDFRATIILEWENAVLSELERTLHMLERLDAQIAQMHGDFELLVLFDPAVVDEARIHTHIITRLKLSASQVSLRMIAAPDQHYYALKNIGAQHAQGDLLVMLDSDVIPEDGWLSTLLGTLDAHPDIQVLGGNTFIDPVGLLGKAFSAGWFFPLREERREIIEPAPGLFANNCVFRRPIFLAHPYPLDDDGSNRGACYRQYKAMKQCGTRIALHTGAQCSHPAPNGLHHWLIRALAEGRDHSIRKASTLRGKPGALRRSLRHATRSIWQACSRSLRADTRQRMCMTPLEAPASIVMTIMYYGLYVIGTTLTCIAPQRTRHWWQI